MTNPLDEITGNAMRSQAVLSIVREAMDEGSCDLATVSLKTDRFGPSFGEILPDEYAAAVAMLAPITGEPQPINGETAEPITGEPQPITGDKQPITPRDPQPSEGGYNMTRDEAQAHMKSLDDAVHTARQARMKAEDDMRAARTALWNATGLWNGTQGYSREMLVRDTLKANQQNKIDIAEGRVQAPTRNPRALNSVIDREAYYRGTGDASTHVRAQHQYGSFHRAGVGADGLLHRPGRRGAKVPSER
jgi:hypothetical protein